MANDEVTLFAEASPKSLELRREIEKTGVAVHLVYCDHRPGVPYVESRLATIRGFENIRRFFTIPA
jgi:hypothetical protein